MEETGYFFPVIDLQVRYIQAIKFEQHITVRATLKSWENTLTIDYLIADFQSGQRLTRASTTQVAVLMPEQITQYQSPPELITNIQAAFARME
jgi:acyl-CoA thioester hydrolase